MAGQLPTAQSPDRGRFRRVVFWFAILLGALVLGHVMLAYLESSSGGRLIEF